MSNYNAPYVKDHHGAVVVAVGYALVIVTLGLAAVRVYSILRRKQKPGIDGYTFLLATVGNPHNSVSKFETLKN